MKLCFVTGTRADYGLLQPVIAAASADPAFEVQIVASAMHLAPEFGLTKREILEDGFTIDAEVEMLLASDSAVGVAKSMGVGTIGFADAFSRLAPDLIMLLGDRFEALSAAQTALILGIPVAHVSGGDLTFGAFDDSIRHAITKLSHLHFTATEEAARRVRQLGEPETRVFAHGDPGLDRLKTFERLDRAALEDQLGIRFAKHTVLMTFHPVTVDAMGSLDQLDIVLRAIDRLGDDFTTVITMPNADPEGRALAQRLKAFAETRARVWCFESLGSRRYLSMLAECDAVVGNSSSGLLEAPSFGKATVNIGRRQAGRVRGASVLDVPVETDAIHAAIERAVNSDFSGIENPYGDGDTAPRIIAALKAIQDPKSLIAKEFVDHD